MRWLRDLAQRYPSHEGRRAYVSECTTVHQEHQGIDGLQCGTPQAIVRADGNDLLRLRGIDVEPGPPAD
eukprot:14621552-Heterocapsa_arctica.AAC.1